MKGLILTYILAALSGLGSLRYPVIGVMAYIFFGVLRPRFIFGFAGQITDVSFWVGVAMLIGWAFSGLGTWRMGRARPVVVALTVYVVWFLLASALALAPATAFTQLDPLVKLLMPVVVGLTVLNDDTNQRRMFWTIVLAQAYVGFEMNLSYLKGFNAAAEGFGGMDNNFFGASLVSTLGPAIALGISSRTWYERATAYTAVALILHTTLLTFSRGAMVGMLAVGAVGFVMIPKSPRFLVAAALVTILAVRFTGPQLMARYATAFASEEERDGSAESRVELWRDCIKVIAAYPIFGVGPANWRIIAKNYGWSEGKSAHSVWMESAAEVGLPGAAALLFFFCLAALKLWPIARERITDENRYQVAIATGVVLSVVGFVVAGQFVSAPGLEPPYYLVMVGAALLKTRRQPERSTTASTETPVAHRTNPALSPMAPPLPLQTVRRTGPSQKSV
jgi:O-antigen ligase